MPFSVKPTTPIMRRRVWVFRQHLSDDGADYVDGSRAISEQEGVTLVGS